MRSGLLFCTSIYKHISNNISSVLYANTFTDVSMMDVAATHVLGLLHGTRYLLEDFGGTSVNNHSVLFTS